MLRFSSESQSLCWGINWPGILRRQSFDYVNLEGVLIKRVQIFDQNLLKWSAMKWGESGLKQLQKKSRLENKIYLPVASNSDSMKHICQLK